MTDPRCPFCEPDAARVFYRGKLVLGLWDAFPVSPGHALLVPRRHVPAWFDATREEQKALTRAVAVARDAIEQSHQPDGFNIGINVGQAAGQTVFHLHVHVIPRYAGDVPNPRGGVRHIIPGKGSYGDGESDRPEWLGVPHRRPLVRGLEDPFLPHLAGHLARANSVDVAVAFTMYQGLEQLDPYLRDILGRGGRIRYLTGDYLESTDPSALRALLDLKESAGGRIDNRVFETSSGSTFHPKAYIVRYASGQGVAFVGSSNVSRAAFASNAEWNYRVVSSTDAAAFDDVAQGFEELFAHPATSPLTHDWITDYERRREQYPFRALGADSPVEVREQPPVVVPHRIQAEALAALEATRETGNQAGLVVLATGLGKTWLAAFDSRKPGFRRVLFVAHREEILSQAMQTFRRIRPDSSFGHYTGEERQPGADILFASIQTLGRVQHLERFATDAFDYIVVDEFHHAAARTYRLVIDYFRPKFLLGLTATPERTDGGDLLALCGENLVYRRDLLEGIRQELLCPFHYFGVPDEVDYRNIPWRSTRFDEDELTAAVATRSRAQNALEQLRKRGGRRTLAFCVSQRHADFMAEFFSEHGIRVAAVHSGPSSAPRALSLARLQAGELDVVFAVDMFNEGVDLPALDTVMMLRPTESRIIWLQQFGRGLRKAAGKDHLAVIDYIGNHRTFLLKPQTLLGLGPGRSEVLNALIRLESHQFELPPGCEVTYDVEAVNILRALVGTPPTEVVSARYRDFEDLNGARPTAVEMYHEGYNPRSVRNQHGSWLRFVQQMGGLDASQQAALVEAGGFLDSLEVTPMVKSYKMLTLLAMLNADAFPGRIEISALVAGFRSLANRNAHLAREAANALVSDDALRADLERNPIAAWTGGQGTGDIKYFTYADGYFASTVEVSESARAGLQELAREIADWRLAEYLNRPGVSEAQDTPEGFQCKVSHSGGNPILFLPDRDRVEGIPEGWKDIRADGLLYQANVVRVAVNVVRKPGSDVNELPGLLRGWFGPDAGLPGTAHKVVFSRDGDAYDLAPLGRRDARLELWRSYSREEIPALFGLKFSRATWNAGYVVPFGHMFLLVTLKKSGTGGNFLYDDRFLTPSTFQWQSQNRTTQRSPNGQLILHHAARGIPVHLFVRSERKTPNGRSAPFVYCGDVEFVSWEGDKPITVRWQLPTPVPDRLASLLQTGSPNVA